MKNFDAIKNQILAEVRERPLEALMAAGAILTGVAKIGDMGVKANNSRTWKKEVKRRTNNSK